MEQKKDEAVEAKEKCLELVIEAEKNVEKYEMVKKQEKLHQLKIENAKSDEVMDEFAIANHNKG